MSHVLLMKWQLQYRTEVPTILIIILPVYLGGGRKWWEAMKLQATQSVQTKYNHMISIDASSLS